MKMENSVLTGKPYNIGYALSGGFIKGFAHLGVIQALLEHDIKPDIISGVSAGALARRYFMPMATNPIGFWTTFRT